MLKSITCKLAHYDLGISESGRKILIDKNHAPITVLDYAALDDTLRKMCFEGKHIFGEYPRNETYGKISINNASHIISSPHLVINDNVVTLEANVTFLAVSEHLMKKLSITPEQLKFVIRTRHSNVMYVDKLLCIRDIITWDIVDDPKVYNSRRSKRST